MKVKRLYQLFSIHKRQRMIFMKEKQGHLDLKIDGMTIYVSQFCYFKNYIHCQHKYNIEIRFRIGTAETGKNNLKDQVTRTPAKHVF